jgi:hypothetical protein
MARVVTLDGVELASLVGGSSASGLAFFEDGF